MCGLLAAHGRADLVAARGEDDRRARRERGASSSRAWTSACGRRGLGRRRLRRGRRSSSRRRGRRRGGRRGRRAARRARARARACAGRAGRRATAPPPGVPRAAAGAATAASASASARARECRYGRGHRCDVGRCPPAANTSGRGKVALCATQRHAAASLLRRSAARRRSEECAPPAAVVAPPARRTSSGRQRARRRSTTARRGCAGVAILPQRQPARCARAQHACGVRVAAPSRVAVRQQQHVRRERRKEALAQRAAIGRRLAVLRPDAPPTTTRRGRLIAEATTVRSRKYTRPHSMAARRRLLPSSARPATLADAAARGRRLRRQRPARLAQRARGAAGCARSPSTAAASTSWTSAAGARTPVAVRPRPRRALAELARERSRASRRSVASSPSTCPGFGRSQLPREPISIPRLRRRPSTALCDLLELDRVIVVGNSMGGFVAAELALRFPARVERLALVSAAAVSTGDFNPLPAMRRCVGALARTPLGSPDGMRALIGRRRARHLAFATSDAPPDADRHDDAVRADRRPRRARAPRRASRR